jgi:hypothetical protein
MIVEEPRAVAEANPFDPEALLMAATPVCCEDHVTEAVISCVEPSENVPVAVSCNVDPGTMIGFIGATAIDERVFTARTVEPVTPRVALMVVEPAATAVASPCEVMVEMPLFEELQATHVVKSWAEPSAKNPVAVNCRFVPATALGLAGDTVMDTGPCTVAVVVPETPAKVALMVVEPSEAETATPAELIAATVVLDEFHVTSDVISWVTVFDNVAVAENCCMAPAAMVGFAGVTAMAATVAEVSVVEPETPAKVALMVLEPTATAVVTPLVLIVAAAVFDEFQVARPVRSCVALFDRTPVALNC